MNKYQKPNIIKVLQWAHFAVFSSIVAIISGLHIITENFLDILRFPPYVKAVNPLVAGNWPGTLHFYHIILFFFLTLTLIDAFGLFFYSSKIWRIISDITSFLGFMIIWPTALFFVYTLASSGDISFQHILTGLIFFTFTFLIFVLDIVTWYVDEQSLLKFPRK